MREILVGCDPAGKETRYVLEVAQEGEHFVSTLARMLPDGSVEGAKVAPRFYGTSPEQARRRMVSILENQFEEVRSAGES